jgi:hypothetical protein
MKRTEVENNENNFNQAIDIITDFLKSKSTDTCSFIFLSEFEDDGEKGKRLCMTSGNSSVQNAIGLIEVFKALLVKDAIEEHNKTKH